MLGQAPLGLVKFLPGCLLRRRLSMFFCSSVCVSSASASLSSAICRRISAPAIERSNLACCCFWADFFGGGTGLGCGNNICGRVGAGRHLQKLALAAAVALAFSAASRRCRALGFFVALGLLHTLLVKLKALAGMVRFYFFCPCFLNLTFAVTIVLHQRNITGADIGAGTAFNAVKQVVSFQALVSWPGSTKTAVVAAGTLDRPRRTCRSVCRAALARRREFLGSWAPVCSWWF